MYAYSGLFARGAKFGEVAIISTHFSNTHVRACAVSRAYNDIRAIMIERQGAVHCVRMRMSSDRAPAKWRLVTRQWRLFKESAGRLCF